MVGKELIKEGQRLEQAIQDAAEPQTWAFANWLLATFGPPKIGRPEKSTRVDLSLSLKEYAKHSRYSYSHLAGLRKIAHEVPNEEQTQPLTTMRDEKAGRKTRKEHHDDVRQIVKDAIESGQLQPKKARRKNAPRPAAILSEEQIEALAGDDDVTEQDVIRNKKENEAMIESLEEKLGQSSQISDLMERMHVLVEETRGRDVIGELLTLLDDEILSPSQMRVCKRMLDMMKRDLRQLEEALLNNELKFADWNEELNKLTEEGS
jgi:hypothetical protein